MKAPKKKLSKTLTTRTKLSAEQLQRAKGQAAQGAASKYAADGTQSLELTRRLFKARAKAKKFVLYSDQHGKRLYLSNNTKEEFPLTFDKKQARIFYEGFDDPNVKINYWKNIFPTIHFITTHA